MINSGAIVHARETIKDKLGRINDLPTELANTIANIYYKDALFYFDYRNKVRTGSSFIISSINKGEYDNFINDMSHSLYSVSSVPELISNLRKLKIKDHNLYIYAVDLFLDIYKYKINNAHKKSLFIRRILRWLHTPNELPNLLELINVDAL